MESVQVADLIPKLRDAESQFLCMLGQGSFNREPIDVLVELLRKRPSKLPGLERALSITLEKKEFNLPDEAHQLAGLLELGMQGRNHKNYEVGNAFVEKTLRVWKNAVETRALTT